MRPALRPLLACGISAALIAISATSATAGTKTVATPGYTLPADKPVTIVLMRPDVEVGLLAAGSVAQPNAEWTLAARTHLASAMRDRQAARNIAVKEVGDRTGADAQVLADYESLHRAVADAIIQHKYYGAKLPTKKDRFDWTMGPGTRAIGDMSEANYALFVFARDNFASDSRKTMQVAGALGCLIGFCVLVTGGQHIAYASLVELSSGNVVWFNVLRGSKGDIRTAEGARGMVDALTATLPTRPGETVADPSPTK